MDCEIEVKVKYGWLFQEVMLRCMHVLSITDNRSNSYWETDINTNTSHKCQISLCMTNSYWETDLNGEKTGPGNIRHKWPSSKLHLEIIKANILNEIHDDHFKNVTSRVSTRFSFDLASWPSFWLQVTQFWTRNDQDEHFEPYSWWLFKKCDLEIIETNILSKIHDHWFKNVTSGVLTRSSFDLAWWPSFWLQVTQF